MIDLALSLRCQPLTLKASSSTQGARRVNSSRPCGPEMSANAIEIGLSVISRHSTRIK